MRMGEDRLLKASDDAGDRVRRWGSVEAGFGKF